MTRAETHPLTRSFDPVTAIDGLRHRSPRRQESSENPGEDLSLQERVEFPSKRAFGISGNHR
ncbi:hypothetical protein TRIP_B170029 [uncultured Desulfatiglans sp.]|uniref:Uncharacterized protein n=1 Tax=Uncultured Desulfatiglans sp. TaxID=1748965 RepID=A0A653A107_UNCDX|nr:hypothetical protein TRIP_B170029 [uncultured Desulfatiglans sp.]